MRIDIDNSYLAKNPETKSVSFQDSENSKRLGDILDMIGRIAALDFTAVLNPSSKNDVVDAIAVGLNMLSEELNSNVVEKTKLDEVNCKLERFAHTTAHDLKSPLNSIVGLVTILEIALKPDKDSEVHSCLLKIRETTTQMKDLISGILDYSKIAGDEIQKEKIDLNEIIFEVSNLDGILSRAKIEIIDILPTILFNRASMVQVIRNLLDNAVKYSDKKMCLITVRVKEMCDHYQVSISDNGPGIALENQKRIFELFTKVNLSKPDSQGIGLATVRNILETEEEKIWVESSLGEGTVFTFTIKK